MYRGLRRVIPLTAAAALWVLAHPLPAAAQTTLVSSRAALGGTDSIRWDALGGPSANFPSNPVDVLSQGGMSINVSKPPAGSFRRAEQGFNWAGNFAVGDQVLSTENGNTLILVFPIPISGAGAQIQPNLTQFGGLPFTATIEAFDVDGALVGTHTRTDGSSTSTGDNSAIFIGIQSSTANIRKIRFGVPGFSHFGVNQVDFQPSVVPEPGSLALFLPALGAALAGTFRRRRRRRP